MNRRRSLSFMELSHNNGAERLETKRFSPFEAIKQAYKKVQLKYADKLTRDIFRQASQNPSGEVIAKTGVGGFEVSFWHDRSGGEVSEHVFVQNCRSEIGGDFNNFEGITAKAIANDGSGELGPRTYSSFAPDSGDLQLSEIITFLRQAKPEATTPNYNWHT